MCFVWRQELLMDWLIDQVLNTGNKHVKCRSNATQYKYILLTELNSCSCSSYFSCVKSYLWQMTKNTFSIVFNWITARLFQLQQVRSRRLFFIFHTISNKSIKLMIKLQKRLGWLLLPILLLSLRRHWGCFTIKWVEPLGPTPRPYTAPTRLVEFRWKGHINLFAS